MALRLPDIKLRMVPMFGKLIIFAIFGVSMRLRHFFAPDIFRCLPGIRALAGIQAQNVQENEGEVRPLQPASSSSLTDLDISNNRGHSQILLLPFQRIS